VHLRSVSAAVLSVVGLALATSLRGFCGLAPSATLRFSGGSRTALKATLMGGGLRWEKLAKKNKSPGQDPLYRFKMENDPNAPVPWDRSTCEVMVDAMSITKWYWRKIEMENEDLLIQHDIHVGWPQRVFQASMMLAKHYGKDRPPSPWRPVILVFDQPSKEDTWSGLKLKKWHCLQRQGPQDAGFRKWVSLEEIATEPRCTLAWAQTYVDQSASGKTRCDREILYMLEVLTRQFPRRQILVTEDLNLAEEARRYCTVRGAEWFEREVLELAGETQGPKIIEALMGGAYGVEKVTKQLPDAIRNAWMSQ